MEGLRASPVEGWRDAQVVVVNTCAVTAAAEKSARALIRRVHRASPETRIVVTGCYAQRAPEELRGLAGVDAVVGNSHKHEVAPVAMELLRAAGAAGHQEARDNFVPLEALRQPEQPAALRHTSFRAGAGVSCESYAAAGELMAEDSVAGELAGPTVATVYGARRTRPVLKVQDGCANRCSFCVIPETRGPSRSVPLGEALHAARSFAEGGGQELVLSGINLGRWGRELLPARTLPELVRALLEETPLPRLRISSVEPMDWTPELLRLFARYGGGNHPRMAPHAHLPLQSGSDTVLRWMHRRYRPWHYAAKLAELRSLMPDAALGADVMVGFPGETDALFNETIEFLEAQPLTYLHLFPFSPRPRTGAEALHREHAVAAGVVRERMRRLAELHARKQEAFAGRFVGQTLSAVSLRDGTALAGNFLSIRLQAAEPANRLLPVRIASIRIGTDGNKQGPVVALGIVEPRVP